LQPPCYYAILTYGVKGGKGKKRWDIAKNGCYAGYGRKSAAGRM